MERDRLAAGEVVVSAAAFFLSSTWVLKLLENTFDRAFLWPILETTMKC